MAQVTLKQICSLQRSKVEAEHWHVAAPSIASGGNAAPASAYQQSLSSAWRNRFGHERALAAMSLQDQ